MPMFNWSPIVVLTHLSSPLIGDALTLSYLAKNFYLKIIKDLFYWVDLPDSNRQNFDSQSNMSTISIKANI